MAVKQRKYSCQMMHDMLSLKSIFFLLLLVFNSCLSGKAKNKDKFNIVLFLANSNAEAASCEPTGLKFLHFKEKARVKHCDAGSKSEEESAVSQYLSPGSDCTSLFKASLYSLISYCRNMIGMTTALACAENNTFTNSLRMQRSVTKRRFQRDYQGYKIFKSLPLFFPRLRHIPSNQNQIITNPEHTEVFKIRSKRSNTAKKSKLPLKRGIKDPNWDFLGVIATIKMTFFGKLIPDHKNSAEHGEIQVTQGNEKKLEETEQQPAENCLFDLVKETLASVEESCESGFLIIVVGGNLSDVADPYSSLVQSVKHITENTDESNTIIIVTGSCPILENSHNQIKIPVYVKGPPITNIISQTTEVYNIPYAIKNMIADSNVDGNFFTNMRVRRRDKRELKSKANTSSNSIQMLFIAVLIFCLID